MKMTIEGKEIELESSTKTVSLLVILTGLALIGIAELQEVLAYRTALYNLSLLLCLTAAVCLWISDSRGKWADHLLSAGLSLSVIVAALWIQSPELLALLVIPVSLAMLQSGVRGALVTSGIHTGLLVTLVILIPSSFNINSILLPLVLIWSISLIQIWMYQQVFHLSIWSVGYWKRGYELYAQTRDSQEELEKVLKNLSNANQLLVQANKRADRLRNLAENAERMKSLFVARVSHEFRTPLNMIIGLVELMVEAPQIYSVRMPPELENDLEVVLRNCRHLAGMIDDVLELTRAETGNLSLRKDWVNLSDLINEATYVVMPLVKKKSLSLTVHLLEEMPVVYCDRTRIRQVILNLVSNASRFTETGGVQISVELSGELVVVSVADTGRGIAPEDAESIFEPFFQGAGTYAQRQTGGSGLGLTISKQFVELHGGQMWLKSQPGVGSTFYFTLPVRSRTRNMAQPGRWIQPDWIWHEEAFTSAQVENAERYTRPKVVVMDETGAISTSFNRYDDWFDLMILREESELKKVALQNQVDLLWMNVAFPDRLIDLIQSYEQLFPNTPISGSLVSSTSEVLEKYSNIQYLTKPVTLEKLKQALQTISFTFERILVVDDDVDVQRLLSRLLRVCTPGVQVDSLTSGQQALHWLSHNQADLILLDVILPEMDGWEVLERLRQDETTKRIPVMMVSAQDLENQSPTSLLMINYASTGFSLNRILENSMRLSNLLPVNGSMPGSEH